jgi:hypothetical protein
MKDLCDEYARAMRVFLETPIECMYRQKKSEVNYYLRNHLISVHRTNPNMIFEIAADNYLSEEIRRVWAYYSQGRSLEDIILTRTTRHAAAFTRR